MVHNSLEMEPRNHYQPLRAHNGRQAFRLLKILPGQTFEPIVCQSFVASLSNCLRKATECVYDAVSYAWGPAAPKYEIVIDAWPVFVRENLWTFLHQKRDPRKSVVCWIDALCVDQCSLTERASQVQLMHRIYSNAQRVLVWLGPADRYSETAMQLINVVATSSEEEYVPSELSYKALLAWSYRPYWTRTWVVQEFLLAQDAHLICGNEVLKWQTVQRFLYQVARSTIRPSNDNRNRRQWAAFLSSPAYRLLRQRALGDDTKAPLATLLIQNRSTNCHDPRDKVYAMLGLVQEPEPKLRISVSYTKDCRQLLFEVLEYCKIPDKDVMRFARFLADLFQVKGHQMAPLYKSPNLHQHFLAGKEFFTSVFNTGEIIYCSLPRLKQTSFQSGDVDMISGASSHRIHQDSKASKSSKILRDIENVDKRKLEMANSVRLSINRRNWPSAERSTPGSISHKFYLVTVLNSSLAGAGALIGLAVGDIQKGDMVFHFLGHEIAVVWREGSSRTAGPQITGFVVCIAGDVDGKSQDMVTKQPCYHYTIQSEVDCSTTANCLSMWMSASSVLALVG